MAASEAPAMVCTYALPGYAAGFAAVPAERGVGRREWVLIWAPNQPSEYVEGERR
jgi:hypothetical protein